MTIVQDQNKGRVQIVAGVGTTTPHHSLQLAKKAEEIGYDAVVVSPPYYYPLPKGMVEEYFETIADGTDLPVILYNIPLFTQPLSYDLVGRLSKRKNVVGMKDSGGSMVDFVHFRDKMGEGVYLLTGREEILLPCLMMGGKGCMTATSGILPEIMVGVYESWQKGDLDRAKDLQLSILPLVRAMFSLPFPQGFKVALEKRGFDMGPPKQPPSDAERSKFKTEGAKIEKAISDILKRLE
jgi:dihydrodipicolinate synthase/N-acetylneuraminate lyase